MSDPKREVTVNFECPSTPTYAVGGAWGGPSPDGSTIVAHLYVEHATLPNYLKYSAEDMPDGGSRVDLSSEERVSRGDLTREVQASIVLTPEVAISLAQWLVDKAQIALKTRGRRGDDK